MIFYRKRGKNHRLTEEFLIRNDEIALQIERKRGKTSLPSELEEFTAFLLVRASHRH